MIVMMVMIMIIIIFHPYIFLLTQLSIHLLQLSIYVCLCGILIYTMSFRTVMQSIYPSIISIYVYIVMMCRLEDDYDDVSIWRYNVMDGWLWGINNHHYTAIPYQLCKHSYSWQIKVNILFASHLSFMSIHHIYHIYLSIYLLYLYIHHIYQLSVHLSYPSYLSIVSIYPIYWSYLSIYLSYQFIITIFHIYPSIISTIHISLPVAKSTGCWMGRGR